METTKGIKRTQRRISSKFCRRYKKRKANEVNILLSIDLLTNFPTGQFLNYATARNSIKFLRFLIKNCTELHGRSVSTKHLASMTAITEHCENQNIDLIVVPANVHRSIGLSERLVKTVKQTGLYDGRTEWIVPLGPCVLRTNGSNQGNSPTN